MKQLNMKKFAELTGYQYGFIQAVAKAHGSWKSFTEITMANGGINPQYTMLNGFITIDENHQFYKDNYRQYIRSILRPSMFSRSNSLSSLREGQYNKIVNLFNVSTYGDMSESQHLSLIDGEYEGYKRWYSFVVWYIIHDIASKLYLIKKGEFAND